MNEDHQASRRLDEAEPKRMAASVAFVFANDLSTRPFVLPMDPETAEHTDGEAIEDFLARFDPRIAGTDEDDRHASADTFPEDDGKHPLDCAPEESGHPGSPLATDGRHPLDCDPEERAPLPLQRMDGLPLIAQVTANLRAAGITDIYVVCSDIRRDIEEAVGGVSVRFLDYDADAVASKEGASPALDFESFTRGEILWCLEQTGFYADSHDSALFMYADEVGILPRHLKKLRATWELKPYADITACYSEYRPHPPVLFSRSFLERLSACAPVEDIRVEGTAARTVKPYSVVMAVLGDECPVPYAPLPTCVVDGTDDLPASALACLRDSRSPFDRHAHTAALLARTPEEAASERAKAFADRLDASLAADPIPGLTEADAWAKRNKADFPFFASPENAGVVYLDSAATALQPYAAVAKHAEIAAGYDGNIWRGMYAASARATAAYQQAREKTAAFIGAEPREVIFTANTTAAVNLVAQGWAARNLNRGDRILVAANEHHSNMVPWMQLVRERGLQLDFIPIDGSGRIDLEAYRGLLQDGAALVCVVHVSNVVGLMNPVAEMAALAHEAGALILADAAQSVPHFRVNVEELGVDFLAFSGHKLYGPSGVGVLWVRDGVICDMLPPQTGGGTVAEVSYDTIHYRQMPYCFEAGTPAYEQAICLGAAIDTVEAMGMEEMERHVRLMTRYALRALSLTDGASVLGDHSGEDGAMGLLSFSVEGVSDETLCALLARMQVANRAGAHCALPFVDSLGIPGICRMSVGPYTTMEDIEAWAFAVNEAKRICEGMRERV